MIKLVRFAFVPAPCGVAAPARLLSAHIHFTIRLLLALQPQQSTETHTALCRSRLKLQRLQQLCCTVHIVIALAKLPWPTGLPVVEPKRPYWLFVPLNTGLFLWGWHRGFSHRPTGWALPLNNWFRLTSPALNDTWLKCSSYWSWTVVSHRKVFVRIYTAILAEI